MCLHNAAQTQLIASCFQEMVRTNCFALVIFECSNMKVFVTDSKILLPLKQDDANAFEQVYVWYYKTLIIANKDIFKLVLCQL